MPTVTIAIDPETGRADGLTERDRKGFARFVRKVRALGESCLTLTWSEPRSGPFHRRFFKMVATAFEAQERFDDIEQFRQWLIVGAGYCDFFPHPEKGVVAIPRSIAYAKLDQAEFQVLADAVWCFYRSSHARALLYPHLDAAVSWEMVEVVMGGFE